MCIIIDQYKILVFIRCIHNLFLLVLILDELNTYFAATILCNKDLLDVLMHDYPTEFQRMFIRC